MKVYKYWSRFRPTEQIKVVAYGYSDISEAEASKNAEANALRIQNALDSGNKVDSYLYSDRPLREEVKEEIKDNGELTGLITRNIYGALILNTTNTMFIDIDRQYIGQGLIASLKSLFGAGSSKDDDMKTEIEGKVAMYPGMGLRLYKTSNGYRAIVTSKTFDPMSTDSENILKAFDCDPLYMTMCKAQKCYRARLTPKPWQIGFPTPGKGSNSFPFENAEVEQKHRNWEAQYSQASKEYGVCALLGQFGENAVDPKVQQILTIHDKYTCVPGHLA